MLGLSVESGIGSRPTGISTDWAGRIEVEWRAVATNQPHAAVPSRTRLAGPHVHHAHQHAATPPRDSLEYRTRCLQRPEGGE